MCDSKKKRSWCGISDTIPDGYDSIGTRHECLKKGVGIGMNKGTNTETEKRILSNLELLQIANKLGVPITETRQHLTMSIIKQLQELQSK